MKRILITVLMITLFLVVTSCGEKQEAAGADKTKPSQEQSSGGSSKKQLKVMIGETEVKVKWQSNKAVRALKKLVKKKPLTIKMSRYGGFEQVGPIGKELPAKDKEITTKPGDIVLYSGDQMVVFYGSNSWSYTRLGHITNKTKKQLKKLLGKKNVKMKISL